MIIIGYQGIGKSTMAMLANNTIDLESSNFWYKKHEFKRYENWAEVYTNIAKDISACGNIVFTSAHKEVRDALAGCNQDIYVCCPDISLKDEWIKKLDDRYNVTKLDKDMKALTAAKYHFEEQITGLLADAEINGWGVIKITDMNYELADVIKNTIYPEIDDVEEEKETAE